MKNNKWALVGGVFLILIFILAILIPLFSAHTIEAQDMNHILSPPNSQFWFGTDELGRDLFVRIFYGARISLSVGFISALFSLMIGVSLGIAAGYFGSTLDAFIMRFVDLMQSIPSLVLIILISMSFTAFNFLGSSDVLKNVMVMILSLSLVSWFGVARVVRNQVLQIKVMPFIESAQASGSKKFAIMKNHILPHLMGSLLVLFTYLVPSLILYESFLSFLGLGLQPPYSSWGVLADEGWKSFRTYPHLILFPGVGIFLTLLSSQFFGDGLRDWLDPRLIDSDGNGNRPRFWKK